MLPQAGVSAPQQAGLLVMSWVRIAVAWQKARYCGELRVRAGL